MAFAPPDVVVEDEAGAHDVGEVGRGDEQADNGDQGVRVEHAEADEQENQTPHEASEVKFRVRVDAGGCCAAEWSW